MRQGEGPAAIAPVRRARRGMAGFACSLAVLPSFSAFHFLFIIATAFASRACIVIPAYCGPCKGGPGQGESGGPGGGPGQIATCGHHASAMPSAMPCPCAMPCHAMPCHVVSCHASWSSYSPSPNALLPAPCKAWRSESEYGIVMAWHLPGNFLIFRGWEGLVFVLTALIWPVCLSFQCPRPQPVPTSVWATAKAG